MHQVELVDGVLGQHEVCEALRRSNGIKKKMLDIQVATSKSLREFLERDVVPHQGVFVFLPDTNLRRFVNSQGPQRAFVTLEDTFAAAHRYAAQKAAAETAHVDGAAAAEKENGPAGAGVVLSDGDFLLGHGDTDHDNPAANAEAADAAIANGLHDASCAAEADAAEPKVAADDAQLSADVPVIYVLGAAEAAKPISISCDIDLKGFIAGSTRLGVFTGTLKISTGTVNIDSMVLVSNSGNVCIDAADNDGVNVTVCTSILMRESSFNTTLIRGSRVQLRQSKQLVKPPGMTKALKAAGAGAGGGALLYWAWLTPMLVSAGAPITAGPASAVFGSVALTWSATMGTAAFACTGLVAAPVVTFAGYLAYGKLQQWWRSR